MELQKHILPLAVIFQKDESFVKNKMHEICPYTAMFPPRLANLLIQNFTDADAEIYDPFSGRGTTLLQARILGRRCYASDLNPLSYVLSKSKSQNVLFRVIENRLKELESEYHDCSDIKYELDDYEYMKTYYSLNVYKQLIFIKNKLGKKWKENDNTDNFILSLLLGIMHGPTRKNGTSMFLSIQMSNTTVMSKKYVDKYVNIHNLKFPTNENLFEKILYKALKSLKNENKYVKAVFKIGNALECNTIFKNKKFDLILTSPPYLNVFNYTKENWIRLWMLGFDRQTCSREIKLDDNHKYQEYKRFLINFLNSATKSLKQTGRLVLIIGDVEGKYCFKQLWSEIKSYTNLYLMDSYQDKNASFKSTRKNGTRAGHATRIDNICVFKRIKQ